MKEYESEESIIQNLKDAGCEEDKICDFIECMKKGCVKEELKLLAGQREELLDELHQGQKRIDCLDYLVYCIKKGKKTSED